MIPKIAWRNVWRNKLRSLVVMIAIFLGIWSGIFIIGLSMGMNNQRTENFISTSITHIQIHDSLFTEDQKLTYTLPQGDEVKSFMAERYPEAHVSKRTVLSGMASSAKSAQGVQIVGINPKQEKEVTIISESLVEGTYFESDRKNSLLIGKKLADKLGVGIRSKVILTFQNTHSEMTAGAFRVVGIFKSPNSRFDERNVFVQKRDAEKLLDLPEATHEIAMWLNNPEKLDTVAADIRSAFPNVKTETWKQIAPDLSYADEMMVQMLSIIMVIILLALAFGIVNTMLMAILERKRELGMLMAVGMNKIKLFSMIVVETSLLCLISGPLGLLIGYVTIEYFNQNGLNLSMMGEGLSEFGYSIMVYPTLDTNFYFINLGMVVAAALLSSLYPAYKALKLKPVDAIRGL